MSFETSNGVLVDTTVVDECLAANMAVSSTDSLANTTINDVIGNKDDGHTSKSLVGQLRVTEEHMHSACKAYPTGADGVLVTAGSGAVWTTGAFSTIVPAGAIVQDYDVHWISIEAVSDDGVYEITLYNGNNDDEVGRVRVVRDTKFNGTLNIPMQMPVMPAGSRLRAKVMSSNNNVPGAEDTITIAVFYHHY